MMIIHTREIFVCALIALLSACSDSKDGNSENPLGDGQGALPLPPGSVAPAGMVTHYGSVTVADEAGRVSDMVASFYKLDTGVSADFLSSQFDGQSAMCEVQDDGVIDFEEISVVYVPDVPGVGKAPVSAGDSIILSSSAGSFATLNEQPAAAFIFYDLPNMNMLSGLTVPVDLTVDVLGSTEIPVFSSSPVPTVEALGVVDYGDEENVSVTSQFGWTPSNQPGSLLRIFTSTAGGFFLENGVTVTCLVPDTGSFMFPTNIRELLGSEFSGSTPIISRLSINSVQVDTTVLYVIRESFSETN